MQIKLDIQKKNQIVVNRKIAINKTTTFEMKPERDKKIQKKTII
jgi:hypothetical protein